MPPPPGGDPAAVAVLRRDLERAGWTVDSVTALLGPVASSALLRDSALPALRATAGTAVAGDPVAVLTRLLVLGVAVPRRHLDAALAGTGTAGAERLGLVEADGPGPDDAVRPLVDLRPYAATDAAGQAEWWIASDPGEAATGGPLPPGHVLGVGGASTTLARLAVRTPVGRVLDVGTGSGVQALHATRHAASVTATDTSGRALAFAAFNAALAGVDLDLRLGSLLEPVRGQSYDQVVSNPPFVVTPRSAGVPGWTYRDAGLVGDEVVRRLVTGVGEVLAPGGSAQLLGNWEHRRGEGWADRVTGWLEASGLDGWVVQREVQDPAEYAETWIRDGGQRPGPAFDALLGAWLDDFAARGVEAVGFGWVVLHRPPAAAAARPRWRRVEEVARPVHGPLGAHVAQVLAARELLAATGDDALRALRLVVAADVTEERHSRPGDDGPRAVLLRQGGGLGRLVPAGTALAGLVGACDGELAVGQVTAALAALLDADRAALEAELLPQVRELVADGLLGVA